MADFAPVATQIKAPDSFESLGKVLNFANTAQNIQRGNVELQQADIKLQERKALQTLYSNPKQFMKEDGTPDYDRIIIETVRVAPTTGPTFIPHVIQSFKDGAAAQQTLNSMHGDQVKRVGQVIAAAADVTPAQAFAMLDAFEKTNPGLGPVIKVTKKQLEAAAQSGNPEDWRQAALRLARATVSLPEQQASYTDKGITVGDNQTTRVIATNPQGATRPGNPIPGTIAPQLLSNQQLQTIETAPDGSKHIVTKDVHGQIMTTRPLSDVPVGAPSYAQQLNAAPSTQPAPLTQPQPQGYNALNPPPGQTQDLPLAAQERAAINTAAQAIPQQRMNNREILRLADDKFINQTGTGAQTLAKLLSTVGLPVGSSYADNLGQLAHYLAQQAQANAKAMGASTDASREVSAANAGSLNVTPTALREITKVNDAMALGALKFNEGMEKAIAASGNNVLAMRQFKNEWIKVFDPDVYRFENAFESGDKAEITKLLGPEGSPQRRKRAEELAKKRAAMTRLITEGR